MTDDVGLFKRLSQLRKQGDLGAALDALRAALRREQLSAEDFERAGRFLEKARSASDQCSTAVLLGQCTTSWLASALSVTAFRHGVNLQVHQGEFDNVIQELMACPRREDQGVLVLLPWSQRALASTERSTEMRVADELAFWRDAWRVAHDKGFQRIVQVGYDWTGAGAAGLHLGGVDGGGVALLRELNKELRAQLPSDAYFVDLEQVSGGIGRAQFYDPRQYHWTKQPFSQQGVVELSKHVFAGIRALVTGPKKVLVLDLDNTLWGGVVGETGPLGVTFSEGPDGEAFQAFQRHLKALAQRGVLLAVASKNNLADAREPFEKHPDLVLSMEDFAAFEASWQPKAVMLTNMGAALNLGLDSFVFFDDNPVEREHILQALPEVEVVNVPTDPAEYVRALEAGAWFETRALTKEDGARTQQYVVERQRTELKAGFASLDAYLTSLEMLGKVADIDEVDLRRVVQLLAKTNQFNLTTQRHSEPRVREMLATSGNLALALRLRDRFGDYGLVACVLALPDGEDSRTLRIDSWLMSCRVIGRGVEQFLFANVVARARAGGYQRLRGEFRPSAKNAQVASLYTELGFQPAGEGQNGARFYELDLSVTSSPPTFVLPDS